MKNFQQTPRKRREAKTAMANHKAQLAHSNPKHTFERVVVRTKKGAFWEWEWSYRYINIKHRTGKL